MLYDIVIIHYDTHQTEITKLLKRHLFSGIEPVPCFTSKAYCLILANKVYLLSTWFVNILIYIVTPNCVCSYDRRSKDRNNKQK